MNVLSLMKRSNSGLNLNALFKSLGVSAEVSSLPREEWEAAFQRAARGTTYPGAEVVRVTSTMGDGGQMEAILVMLPAPVTGKVTKDSIKIVDALAESL